MAGVLRKGILTPRYLVPATGALLFAGMVLVASMESRPAIAGAAPDGAKVFKAKCAACHAATPTGGPSIGPRLYGVYGRKAGAQPGYNYSNALKNSGIVWNEDNLKKFIANPRSLVPGNHMPFAGDRNPAEVDALVAYLKTLK